MYSIIGTYTNNKMVLYIIHTAHPRKVVAYIHSTYTYTYTCIYYYAARSVVAYIGAVE